MRTAIVDATLRLFALFRFVALASAFAVSAVPLACTQVGQTATTATTVDAAVPSKATGVQTPGVARPISQLLPTAVFPVAGSPDWSVVTASDVWVASARDNHVVQLRPGSNTVGLVADVARPCSGLAAGFGSIWAPSCALHQVIRLDPATGRQVAAISADPANSEGGITVGAGSVWFVVKPSRLIRINPDTNSIVASLDLPSGSENPAFGGGFLWVTSFSQNALLKIDPRTNTIAATIPVGPKPRFLTIGAGSVWTLNQGDGTVSRVSARTGKLTATIACGLPGEGGEISYADGTVWAAIFQVPLTAIDARTNKVAAQWVGNGGDGVRAGLGSVWLSNLRQQTVWRIAPQRNLPQYK